MERASELALSDIIILFKFTVAFAVPTVASSLTRAHSWNIVQLVHAIKPDGMFDQADQYWRGIIAPRTRCFLTPCPAPPSPGQSEVSRVQEASIITLAFVAYAQSFKPMLKFSGSIFAFTQALKHHGLNWRRYCRFPVLSGRLNGSSKVDITSRPIFGPVPPSRKR